MANRKDLRDCYSCHGLRPEKELVHKTTRYGYVPLCKTCSKGFDFGYTCGQRDTNEAWLRRLHNEPQVHTPKVMEVD